MQYAYYLNQTEQELKIRNYSPKNIKKISSRFQKTAIARLAKIIPELISAIFCQLAKDWACAWQLYII